MVVGPPATVPPGDRRFLSPIPDGQGSYERGSTSTLVYRLQRFSLDVLLIWVPGYNSVFYHNDGMLLLVYFGNWTQCCPR